MLRLCQAQCEQLEIENEQLQQALNGVPVENEVPVVTEELGFELALPSNQRVELSSLEGANSSTRAQQYVSPYQCDSINNSNK